MALAKVILLMTVIFYSTGVLIDTISTKIILDFVKIAPNGIPFQESNENVRNLRSTGMLEIILLMEGTMIGLMLFLDYQGLKIVNQTPFYIKIPFYLSFGLIVLLTMYIGGTSIIAGINNFKLMGWI